MSISRLSVAVLVLASSLSAGPAFAEKNNGAYNRSTDAARTRAGAIHCSDLKDFMDANEKSADRLSGTKAAKKYSDAADETYRDAHQFGCSWAH
jgi:hypothetical protein